MPKSSLRKLSLLTLSLATLTTFGFVNVASALGKSPSNTTTSVSTSSSSSPTAADTAKVRVIISRGDKEITRRLDTLSTLNTKISGLTKLSSSDQSSLTLEVTNETSGLNSLKTTLDAETTLSAAKADAQSIFNDYRVYALVVPKVALVKAADDQQVTETKLSALATKLHARVTGTSATLSDMDAKISAAQTISSSVESKVVNLAPADYDSDHTILNGDHSQLVTAQSDLKIAASDAKQLIASLKS